MTLTEHYDSLVAGAKLGTNPQHAMLGLLQLIARDMDQNAAFLNRMRQDYPDAPSIDHPAAKSWRDAFGSLNGWGDLINCIRDMLPKIDAMTEFCLRYSAMDEIAMPVAETPAKRRPGRPRKTA